MKCHNCEAVVPADAERCESCGVKLLVRPVILGVPRSAEFTLKAEAEPLKFDRPVASDDWQLSAPVEAPAPAAEQPSAILPEISYGGFLRRLVAFAIDGLMIFLLSALMGAMAYIGYKVGLAAHGRFISWNTASPLMFFLTLGWMLLGTTYFVVFHGMDGQTIGKWLLGLRVVGLAQQPISYRRALLRWVATLGLGCASIGLSFFWILGSPEKRAWHDLVTRTWVIQD